MQCFRAPFLRKILYSGYIHFVLHCCLFRVVVFLFVCLSLVYLALDYETQVYSMLLRSVFAHNYFRSRSLCLFYFCLFSVYFVGSDGWIFFFVSCFCIRLYLPFHLTYFISIYVRSSSLAHAVGECVCVYSNESQNSNSNRVQAALPIYGFFSTTL